MDNKNIKQDNSTTDSMSINVMPVKAYAEAELFATMDKLMGPDGVMYYPKKMTAQLDRALMLLQKIFDNKLNKYINALPVIFTFDPSLGGTFATDGNYIFINPAFFMALENNLPLKGIAFVFLHEIYHNLFRHFDRAKEHPEFSDHDRLNVAQDAEINWLIENAVLTQSKKRENGKLVIDPSTGSVKTEVSFPFKGVVKQLHGVLLDEFPNELFEYIYPELPEKEVKKVPPPPIERIDSSIIPPPDSPQGPDNVEIEYSDEYLNGFAAGIAAELHRMEQEGLIVLESLRNSRQDILSILNENMFGRTGGGTYNDGFSDGGNYIRNQIEMLRNATQNNNGNSSAPQINLPNIPKIPGINKIKLNFPVKDQDSKGSQEKDNIEIPLEINSKSTDSNDSSANSQTQDGTGKDSSSQTQDGTGKDSSSQTQDGTGKDSSAGSTPKIESGAVQDTDDGMHMGSDHLISQDEAREIAKRAGYDYDSGRMSTNMPFEDIEEVQRDIASIMNKASNLADQYNGQHDSPKNINGQPGNPDKSYVDPSAYKGIVDKFNNICTEIYTSTVDWVSMIRSAISGTLTQLKNKGYKSKHLYYDRYVHRQKEVPDHPDRLLLFIDTSGSIWSDENTATYEGSAYIRLVISEMANMSAELQVKNVDLYFFNNQVYNGIQIDADDFQSGDFIIPKITDGGTVYKNIFKTVEKNYIDEGIEFAACVIFTDADVFNYTSKEEFRDSNIDWDDRLVVAVVHQDNRITSANDTGKEGRTTIDISDNKDYTVPAGELVMINKNNFIKTLKNDLMMGRDKSFVTDTDESLSESQYIQKVRNNLKRGMIKNKSRYVLNEDIFDDELYYDDDYEDVQSAQDNLASVDKKNTAEISRLAKMTPVEYITEWLDSNNIEGYSILEDNVIEISGDVIFSNNALLDWPEYIVIEAVKGNCTVSSNGVTEFPEGFPRVVEGNFMVLKCKNLVSLKNGPDYVSGNYIVRGSYNMKSLRYGPISVGGYFQTDYYKGNDYKSLLKMKEKKANAVYTLRHKTGSIPDLDREALSARTRERYRNVLKGNNRSMIAKKGGKMPLPESWRRKYVKEYIAERAMAKKGYAELNEDFKKPEQIPGQPKRVNRLSKLFMNPINADAKAAIKNINVTWSDIDDSQIEYQPYVLKSIQGRRSRSKKINMRGKEEPVYGLSIWCSPGQSINDHKINIISTGNNTGNWKNETWLYISREAWNALKERVMLAYAATAGDTSAQKMLQEIASRNHKKTIYEKDDVLRPVKKLKGRLNSVWELTYPMLYLIPDYADVTYNIVNPYGDPDAKGYDYREDKYEKRYPKQKEREEANKDTYIGYSEGKYKSKSVNPNSPQFRKYGEKYITPEDEYSENQEIYKSEAFKSNLDAILLDAKTVIDQLYTRLTADRKDSLPLDVRKILVQTYYRYCEQPYSALKDKIEKYLNAFPGKDTIGNEVFQEILNGNTSPAELVKTYKNDRTVLFRYNSLREILRAYEKVLNRAAEMSAQINAASTEEAKAEDYRSLEDWIQKNSWV